MSRREQGMRRELLDDVSRSRVELESEVELEFRLFIARWIRKACDRWARFLRHCRWYESEVVSTHAARVAALVTRRLLLAGGLEAMNNCGR